MRARLWFLLLAWVVASPSAAQEFRFAGLIIAEPWARATATPGQAGAVYMTLTNEAGAGDFLVAASTAIAAVAQLHETQITNGVARMVAVERVGVGAGVGAAAQAELAPGGIHIMLMGLTAPLTEGQSFPMTLTFERAGSTVIEVQVRPLGG